jgi:hypothetical protein
VSHLRPVGRGQGAWDVANGEAHVRATLDAWLGENSAYLGPQQYARAIHSLFIVFWQLSGFEHDWKTPRYVWELRGFLAPARRGDAFKALKPVQFTTEQRARAALAALELGGNRIFLASIAKVRPRGAYDPRFGQSFSTYSRRILTLRIADFYRSDEEFGDTRYEGNRGREESLEALAERRRRDDDQDGGFLDRHSPGSRLDFVDELNRHAYQEPIEEVLNNAAVGI